MKIRHPFMIHGVGIAGAALVRALVGTCRFHFRYLDPTVNPANARKTGQRYIYAFFHEVMLFPAYYWNWPEMHILISDHADGEMIAQVVRRLGFGVVRGSTTRGGARALRTMFDQVPTGHLCFTPDGPRGPRRHVHQGMIYAASRLGFPIVGAGMAFSPVWRAKSWDEFAVPKPFAHATCVVPHPVHVTAGADRETLEHFRIEVETRMNWAMREAAHWAEHLAAKRRRRVGGPHRNRRTGAGATSSDLTLP
jgi:lysophospholipid acyltransferase (LPLAT)-like uncharacterized protein